MSDWITLKQNLPQKFIPLLLALMLINVSGGCNSKNTNAQSNNNQLEQKIVNSNDYPKSTLSPADLLHKRDRLAMVKNRGSLFCGINGQLPGFSAVDEQGNYSGIDVDLCRAVAAALFDDPTKIEYRELNTGERFTAVQSGAVDLLSRNTTWTLSRDTSVGLEFTPTTFYDGQSLLVGEASNIERLEDLDGKSICVLLGTTNEQNLTEQMRKQNLNYAPVVFEETDALYSAYEQKNCDAVTSDRSQLIVRRASLTNPDTHKVLDLVLSKEPLGPLIANGQPQWFDVVKWVTYAMIRAEELDINSQNIDSFFQTNNPEIRRFLGLEGKLGESLGLSNDFTVRVIKHVGNYGEVYERHIGKPFGLERGLNALSTDGGLMYSPPFR